MILSLDIETYGKAENDHLGPLPPQAHMHPEKCIHLDGVSRDRLILTCCLTIAKSGDSIAEWNDSAISSAGSPLHYLCSLSAGSTVPFVLSNPQHRRWLRQWLARGSLFIGHNILFDLLFLRSQPDLAPVLQGTTTLIDTSVVNFLHNEMNPAKSLKDLGPAFALYEYTEEERQGEHRYPTYLDPKLLLYNARDTHRTLCLLIHLCNLIQKDTQCLKSTGPSSSLPASPSLGHSGSPSGTSSVPLLTRRSDKLSAYCINFYSEVIWSLVQMSEAGIPLSRDALQSLEDQCLADAAVLQAKASQHVTLRGKGSDASRRDFIHHALAAIDEAGVDHGQETIFSHKLVEYTPPPNRKLSASEMNRSLVEALLPKDHALNPIISAWNDSTYFEGLVSRNTFPLLRHHRSNPEDNSCRLIPLTPS